MTHSQDFIVAHRGRKGTHDRSCASTFTCSLPLCKPPPSPATVTTPGVLPLIGGLEGGKLRLEVPELREPLLARRDLPLHGTSPGAPPPVPSQPDGCARGWAWDSSMASARVSSCGGPRPKGGWCVAAKRGSDERNGSKSPWLTFYT